MAKPITDKIAALKAKQEKLSAELSTLSAKAKTEERKRDTRRKILVGGAVLAAIDGNAALADMVRLVMGESVIRPADREILGDLLNGTAGASASVALDTPAQAA